MAIKSVAKEAQEIGLASDMIELGARLQVLQAETSLSYDRLARLYREVKGCSPPKGMLPFSVDWFMTWLPNIHSSLFYSIYQFMALHTPCDKSRALVEAYRLYLEQSSAGRLDVGPDEEPVLSFTRAWMLLRFFDSGLLQLSQCERCKGVCGPCARSRSRLYLRYLSPASASWQDACQQGAQHSEIACRQKSKIRLDQRAASRGLGARRRSGRRARLAIAFVVSMQQSRMDAGF